MNLFIQPVHQGIKMDKKPGRSEGFTSGSLSELIPWKSVEGAWQEDAFHPCVLKCPVSSVLQQGSQTRKRADHCIFWSIYFGKISDLCRSWYVTLKYLWIIITVGHFGMFSKTQYVKLNSFEPSST